VLYLAVCDVLIVTPFSNSGENNAIQLATNIQNILRYESYIDRYRDAANGSFYIESLTQQFGQQAWQQFIDSK
jgi:methylmalonyl-CoA mutase